MMMFLGRTLGKLNLKQKILFKKIYKLRKVQYKCERGNDTEKYSVRAVQFN